jgi:orotidine-5'-phosphate decarboxylase
MNRFTDRLRDVQKARKSFLCVGLDPDMARMPAQLLSGGIEDSLVAFCEGIIESTAPFACAYKLNFAFFERHGVEGWRALERVAAAVPPDILTIADAKRGDIGNTSRFYADSAFSLPGCDAITVSPYMGRDSVQPFLEYPGRAVFVLARTSNPGGADFQEMLVDGEPLYARVARLAVEWASGMDGEAGLVVGATDTDAARELRRLCPNTPFLVPGVGAQGGDVPAIMDAVGAAPGNALINSSRQILYASEGTDFGRAAADAAASIRDELNANAEWDLAP